jgi:ribosome-associated toxin RatA of RatAB toxin-antitoxin module
MAMPRVNLRLTLVVLALFAFGAPGVAAEPAIDVKVQQTAEGIYVVTGSFDVGSTSEAVWQVLTDYEAIGRFVSSISRSTIKKRESGRILLEQEGVGRAWVFSRRLHILLDVQEHEQQAISFRDVCGESFKTYEGRWQLSAKPGGTRVAYELRAVPSGRQPGFIARTVIRKNVEGLLGDVRREVMGRFGQRNTMSKAGGLQ